MVWLESSLDRSGFAALGSASPDYGINGFDDSSQVYLYPDSAKEHVRLRLLDGRSMPISNGSMYVHT